MVKKEKERGREVSNTVQASGRETPGGFFPVYKSQTKFRKTASWNTQKSRKANDKNNDGNNKNKEGGEHITNK